MRLLNKDDDPFRRRNLEAQFDEVVRASARDKTPTVEETVAVGTPDSNPGSSSDDDKKKKKPKRDQSPDDSPGPARKSRRQTDSRIRSHSATDSASERCSPPRRRRSRRRSSSKRDDSLPSGRSIKAPKYDGQTCLDTFLTQFRICAEHNKWRPKEKLAQLKYALTGTAAQPV